MADGQLIGTKVAAKYLGFSQEWLQRNTKNLSIPHRVLNGHFYYTISDLQEWMEAQKLKANSPRSYIRPTGPMKVKLVQR